MVDDSPEDAVSLTEQVAKLVAGIVTIGYARKALERLEPGCRICRNDQLRRKVNDLLATGARTIDSVRNHCGRRFPVQQVARATYREILERRGSENEVDFVEGVATAITPIAFLRGRHGERL